MFICEDCIKNYQIDVPKEFLLRSQGPCEDCHKVKLCYDVPHGKYMHKDSPMAKRLRENAK